MNCPHCGEHDALAYSNDGRCWECGHLLVSAAPVFVKKSEEQLKNEADEKAVSQAEKLIPVLASKLQSCNKFQLTELVKATCKKNGSLFASHFTRLIVADERFASMCGVWSPAQKEGRW